MATIPIWALIVSGILMLLLSGGVFVFALTVKRLKERLEEHALSEKQLKQSTAHFRNMADAVRDGITVIEDGKVTYVNDGACEIFGYPREELLDLNGLDIAAPEEKERLKKLQEEIREKGTPLKDYRFWIIRKDGSRRYIHNRYAVHREDGKITNRYVISTDITEHQQSSNALRESEEKYRTLFELAPESIIVVDLNGVIIDCNAAAARMADIPKKELIGQPFTSLDFFEPGMLPEYLEIFQQLMENESMPPIELQITNRANRSYRIEAYLAPLKKQDKLWAFQVITRDITQRLRAEEEFRRSAARLKTLREIDQVILAAKSAEAIAQAALRRVPELMPLCNRASVTLFDMEQDELIVLAVHTTIETHLKAGLHLPLEKETSFVKVLAPNQILLVDRVIGTTQMYQMLQSEGIYSLLHVPLYIEHELIGSLNLGSTSPNAFPSESLEVAQELADQLAIAIRQARLLEQAQLQAEILEQRVAERTTDLERAYINVQKLAKIKDEFVANVSHELRTPITNLKLYQELMTARPKQWDQYMAVIRRETARLEHIIEDLLMLSRLDRGKTQLDVRSFDLNKLIEEYVSDRASMAGNRRLTLKMEGDPDLPLVVADRGLIGQVLSILLTNAINYTPEDGTIVVCSEKLESGAEKWVGFRVSDTGPGVPPDEQIYMFDRFFRGKAGRDSGTPGTGLGLAIVKEIIRQHQGEVEVTSKGISGEGTTFSIWLPV